METKKTDVSGKQHLFEKENFEFPLTLKHESKKIKFIFEIMDVRKTVKTGSSKSLRFGN